MADARQPIDLELARRIDLACDRFESNWRLGRRQSVEIYLVSVAPAEREACLKALLEIEVDLRGQEGDRPTLEEYLDRFPDHPVSIRAVFSPNRPTDSLASRRSTMDSQAERTGAGGSRNEPGRVRQILPVEFGRYRVKQQIGAGGMGTVVLAEDTLLGRSVALKIPYLTGGDQKEQLERFDRETRTAAILRHPNICPIYDVGEVDGIRYISMAYIEGTTLSKHVADEQLGERQIARLIWKLAGALQEAHDHEIVHRDLKPANVLVDRKGEPIVMDFGLAMQMQFTSDVRLTQTGMQMGSPAYMSPEQVDGDTQRIGPAADIYTLGVVLYELLTGRIPFEGPIASIFAQIIMNPPTPPSQRRDGLSPALEAICLKMMAKRIEDRYGSMDEVAAALTDYVKQQRELSQSPQTSTSSGTYELRQPDTELANVHEPPSIETFLNRISEDAEERLLLLDINNALRNHQTDGLLEKVERFLQLRPHNPAMLRLRNKLRRWSGLIGLAKTIQQRTLDHITAIALVGLIAVILMWSKAADRPNVNSSSGTVGVPGQHLPQNSPIPADQRNINKQQPPIPTDIFGPPIKSNKTQSVTSGNRPSRPLFDSGQSESAVPLKKSSGSKGIKAHQNEGAGPSNPSTNPAANQPTQTGNVAINIPTSVAAPPVARPSRLKTSGRS